MLWQPDLPCLAVQGAELQDQSRTGTAPVSRSSAPAPVHVSDYAGFATPPSGIRRIPTALEARKQYSANYGAQCFT